MEKNRNVKNVLEILNDSAILLLIFIGSVIFITSAMFFVKVSINGVSVIFSCVITVMIFMYLHKEKKRSTKIFSIILALFILAIAIAISSHTYDLTWDGNTHHKLGVGCLKDGRNPIYQNVDEYIESDVKDVGIQDDGLNSIWIEHYPKASWIFAANIYLLTNNIEASKILLLLMMYICFSIMLNYLYKKTNIVYSFLIPLLTVVNPITIVQMFNFYVDGLMGVCLYIILFSLIVLSDKELEKEDKNRVCKKEYWVTLAISLMLCINLKFTGLVYSAIFCIMFFVLWMYRAYKKSSIKQYLRKYITYYATVVFISMVVVGFSPYIKNTINQGNPLYPLMGKNKVDIMTHNEPKSFIVRNSIDKFLTSLFGVSENIQSNSSDKDPQVKIPFVIHDKEMQAYNKPDLRISGFGVWFSGIFVISLGCIGYYAYKFYKCKNVEMLYVIVAYTAISAILVIITEGSWWARYVPYIYLFPIIALGLLCIIDHKGKAKALGTLLFILLIVNSGIILNTTYQHYYRQYKTINAEMRYIKKINKKYGNVKIYIKDNAFSSVLYNLRDNHINFELVDKKPNLKNYKYVNRFYYNTK